MPKSNKPKEMSRYFVNDLNQMHGYKAIYLDWRSVNKTTQTNKDDILNLKVPQQYAIIASKIIPHGEYNRKSIDIFRKSYFGLSYFYYETNYRWVHRSTDDNTINLERLESFYKSIEEEYDPLKEPVVLGCCVKHPKTLGFLQGGVGYLYSRKAVELMLPIYENIIFNCKLPEDVCHDEFLKKLNITMIDATSLSFLGHPFRQEDLERIEKNNFSDIQTCPKVEYPKNLYHCGVFNGPLNNVVFLHHHVEGGINEIIKTSKQIFAVKDDNVHFYFENLKHPELCKPQ